MLKRACTSLCASLLAAAGVFLIGGSPSAMAASITITDGSCTQFNVDPASTPGAFKIVCGAAAPVACTLNASATSANPGTGITLTAACIGGSGSYTYNGIAIASGSGCPVPSGQVSSTGSTATV